jgi:choline dehydrogenase-like flavoprotein
LTTLAGTLESFARAAEVILPKMSGLSIAESTVERTTEAIGAELGRAVEAKVAFDEARAWDWHKDAEGMTCAYVSIDLTGVAKQGPGGSAADGEMAAVGMVYNPVPDDRRQWADPRGRRPDWQARYVASLEGQEAVAEPLHHTAGRVGIGGARRWIAVCDGGSGLEDLLRLHFGRIDAVILDFYHASEHLGDFAKAWHPGDAEAAEAAHAEWSHRLKHEGGAAVTWHTVDLDWPGRPG